MDKKDYHYVDTIILNAHSCVLNEAPLNINVSIPFMLSFQIAFLFHCELIKCLVTTKQQNEDRREEQRKSSYRSTGTDECWKVG